MANPITNSVVAQLPPTTQPISDKDGNIVTPWYQYLYALYLRTGEGQGINVAEIQQEVQQANTTAIAADATANSGLALAETVETGLQSTTIIAVNAQNLANVAQRNIATINQTALFAANNLSELADDGTARANLGVSTFPLIFQIDSATNGIKRLIPAWRPLTFGTNFSGSIGYCMIAPTANVTLNIGYIRSGVSTVIGSMTFYAGTQIAFFTAQPPSSVQTGDIITLIGPSDPTMAQVGITLLTTVG